MAHVLRGKKTVNLKDLESPQGNRMKKSISENEASDVTNCGIKGSSNVSLNTKLKKNTRQRCYGNNAKRRRTQTSEDLGVQVCND
jgi:prolyl-tRNA editing enzyme YbaK/EbsC (Cys-tRNA(Pro) deacylase)